MKVRMTLTVQLTRALLSSQFKDGEKRGEEKGGKAAADKRIGEREMDQRLLSPKPHYRVY